MTQSRDSEDDVNAIAGDDRPTDAEVEPVVEPPKPSRGLTVFGLAATVTWCLLLAGYAWLARDKWAGLEPNAVGDFFSGAFAPLAFLWLVLGFFQQGTELRQSSEALRLQGRELQNSVRQQRELVKVTREQLQFDSAMLAAQRDELERTAKPIIAIRQGGNGPGNSGTRRHSFGVNNYGKRCTAVRVLVDGKARGGQELLDTGGTITFYLDFPPAGTIVPVHVEVSYIDDRGISGRQSFLISGESPFTIAQTND